MTPHITRLRRLGIATCLSLSFALPAVSAALAQEPTLLRMNMVVSQSDPSFALWEQFASDIEERSEGTLRLEVYPTEALGTTVNMIEGISRGAPVLQDSDPSHLFDYVPDFAVFMAPYLLKEPGDIEKAWNSELVADLEEQLQEQGLRIVTLVYFGTRHLLTNRQIFERSDTEGLKMRNAPTRMWNEVSNVLGGNPTNTAWSETYTALEQGVADTVESPLAVLHSTGLTETRPYISLTGHLVATTSIIMSQQVYESLPPQAQQALDEVGRAEPARRVEAVTAIEAEYRQILEDSGITFNDVNRESFYEAAAAVPAAFPEWSEGLYERILAAIE